MLASNTQTFVGGIFLLIVYALGVTIPLFIFAAFFDFFASKMKFLKKYGKKLYKIGAIIILIVGLMLLFGIYDDISGFVIRTLMLSNDAR